MALKARLATRQAAVSATPEMRAALRLLSLPGADLDAVVAAEIERNPFLERRPFRGAPPGRALIDVEAPGPSLTAHLISQLAQARLSPADRALGARLIGEIDERGYLRADAAALAAAFGADPVRVGEVCGVLRGFTPAGVFARDLADCLGLQLAAKGRLDPIAARLLKHLRAVAKGGAEALAQAAGVDLEDAREFLGEIAALSARPGAEALETQALLAPPDVIVTRAGDGWDVALNPGVSAGVRVNESYYARVSPRLQGDELRFAAEALKRGRWLNRTLEQRARTLLRVSRAIVDKQQAFLAGGKRRLRVLTMSVIGEETKLHPSTISRAVANKTAATPQGVVALRALFCGGPAEDDASFEAVRHRIKALVAGERAAKDVLSDEAIAAALRRDGVSLARRTVTKYREAMRVGSSRERRRALAAKH